MLLAPSESMLSVAAPVLLLAGVKITIIPVEYDVRSGVMLPVIVFVPATVASTLTALTWNSRTRSAICCRAVSLTAAAAIPSGQPLGGAALLELGLVDQLVTGM